MNEFFNQIGDFFLERPLTNEEQLLLGFLAVLIFFLGLLVGWLVQRSATRRYKKELLLLRKDRDEYEVRYQTAESKRKAVAKELEALSREKVEALDRLQASRADVERLEQNLAQLQAGNEELTATNQSYVGTIESLNDQVIGLKTQNEQLLQGDRAGDSPQERYEPPGGAAAGAGNGGRPTTGGAYAPTSGGPSDGWGAYVATTEARFRLFEERLAALSEQNHRLRYQTPYEPPSPSAHPFDTVGTGGAFHDHQPQLDPNLSAPPPVATDADGEPLVIRADTTAPGVRMGQGGEAEVVVQGSPSLQVPPLQGDQELSQKQDDLTLIDHIGPFLQNRLHDVDIYRFEQIAAWTPQDIVTYTELIEYVPGVIEKDDWVGQARALAMSEAAYGDPITSPTEQETPPASDWDTEEEHEADDDTLAPAPAADGESLTVVEGIGPKTQQLLHQAGILTLSQLADTPVERLRALLDEAGGSFRGRDPKTWAAQAGLAADGKYDELEAWQQELKGGR